MEADSTARVFVEMLLNTCAPVFGTELQVVPIDFPRKAVNHLVIGVDATPRVAGCGTWLSKKTGRAGRRDRSKKDGQARGMTRRSGHWHIAKSNRTRIKARILWEKSFRKSVPAIPEFINFRRRENVHIGERDKLNPRRCHCVESRELTTRSVEGKGESLGAVAEEISPGHGIALVEVLIDLGDEAAEVVERRRNYLGIISTWAAEVFSRCRR